MNPWDLIKENRASLTKEEMLTVISQCMSYCWDDGEWDWMYRTWDWQKAAPFDWIDTLLELIAEPPDLTVFPEPVHSEYEEALELATLFLFDWAGENPQGFLQKAFRLLPNSAIRREIIDIAPTYDLREALPYLENLQSSGEITDEEEIQWLEDAIQKLKMPRMLAARLHGPADLRVEEVPHPGAPDVGEVLLRVRSTGICGSDLHPYENGAMGDTMLGAPLILGHEFSGVVEEIGEGVTLEIGTRVAVDPAWTCGKCRECVNGHPNLCRQQKFCGLFPNGGSLCELMRVPARFCHAIPDSISDDEAALLEPLGVALHATNLARIRVGDSVAILGAGPIGLCLIQLAKLAGAKTVYVTEKLSWRLQVAQKFGALPLPEKTEVDVSIEAAWVTETAQQAVEITRPGGVVVLVGIPLEDEITLKHSALRRKGLTLLMCRRMKHVYGRTIPLVESGQVDLKSLITHRFPLAEAPEAFRMNAKYEDEVVKVIISG